VSSAASAVTHLIIIGISFMKIKIVKAYMDTAFRFAECSTAVRAKVGAIVVKDDSIISIGYNGTPSGWGNCCETREYMSPDAGSWLDPDTIEEQWPYTEIVEEADVEVDQEAYKAYVAVLNTNEFVAPLEIHYRKTGEVFRSEKRYALVTKPEVNHAEFNAIVKLAKRTESSDGATLFCTHSPCENCAKLIALSGIRTVYYGKDWPSSKTSPQGLEYLKKSSVEVIRVLGYQE